MEKKTKYTLVAAGFAIGLLALVAVFARPLFSYLASIVAVAISVSSVYAAVENPPDLSIAEIASRSSQLVIRVHNGADSGKARGCQGKVDIECGPQDFPTAQQQGQSLTFLNKGNVPPGGIRAASLVWARSPVKDHIDIDPDDDETLLVARVIRAAQPMIAVFSEEGDLGTVTGPITTKARALLLSRDAPYRVVIRVGAENLGRRISTSFLLSVNTMGDGFEIRLPPS